MNGSGGLSRIVKNVTLVLAVPTIVFGLYVVLHGHLTPGGGFAGGAVMATFIALFLVSFRKEIGGRINASAFPICESLGLLAFTGLALLGISSTFFYNFLANSDFLFGTSVPFGANPGCLGTGGITPLMNIAVGLEVFSGLSLVIFTMTCSTLRGDKND